MLSTSVAAPSQLAYGAALRGECPFFHAHCPGEWHVADTPRRSPGTRRAGHALLHSARDTITRTFKRSA